MNKNLLKAGAAFFALASLSAGNAYAVDVTNDASVTIVEPPTVTANDDMDFGKVVQPASGSETVILKTDGSVDAASTAQTVSSSTAAGTLTISGSSSETVAISVTDDANVTGLTLGSFTSQTFGGQTLSGGSLSGATLTGGSDTLTLGATLTVASTVTTGALTPTFTVAVDYE